MRTATLADIPVILGMVEALVRASGHPTEVDRAHTAGVLARLIGSADGLVLIARDAFLAAEMRPTTVSPEPLAIEHGWYFRDAVGLRLLRAYEAWASERGCRTVTMTTWATNPRAAAILARSGYCPVEMAWRKAV